MPTSPLPWIRLTLTAEGGKLAVTPDKSHGPGNKIKTGISLDDLEDLAEAIGERAQQDGALADLAPARRLYQEVFAGSVLEQVASTRAEAGGGRFLVRLAIPQADLRGVPFEAMYTPAGGGLGTDGFLAASPRLDVLRDAIGAEPPRPLRVPGRVRVLVLKLAPSGVDTAIAGALAEVGDVAVVDGTEWADAGPLIPALEEHAEQGERPHVLHVIAHGGVSNLGGVETPILRGDARGGVEVQASALAGELVRLFGGDLRLVVLDACDGAAPGWSGSAAEALAKDAAVAVVAHLWTVLAPVAAEISRTFYTRLTSSSAMGGDVAASLSAARAALLPQRAAGLSPVLYLRGEPRLFDFRGREKPAEKQARAGAAREEVVTRLLGAPFAALLGDRSEDSPAWRGALRAKLAEKLGVRAEELPPLSQAVERYALTEGRAAVDPLFVEVTRSLLLGNDAPVTPVAWELARLLAPGVHATLSLLPALEQALADRHPTSGVYVVTLVKGLLSVLWRNPLNPSGAWEQAPDRWASQYRADRDYVILRPHRGLLPTGEVLDAVLTDDDHVQNPRGAEMPKGWDPLVRRLRLFPALIVGVSLLDWRDRMALRALFTWGLSEESVAVVSPDADDMEERIWRQRGGWDETSKGRPVEVARLSAGALARLMEMEEPPS